MWISYDGDKSGTLSGFEFRDAIQSAGYLLNKRALNVLMHRYGNRNGEIQFDDFLMCAVKVKTMIGEDLTVLPFLYIACIFSDMFKIKDRTETNSATFSLDEWLESTLYT